MERLRNRLQLSFRTKVLLPVVTIMVLLLALTAWVVNRRLTQQFQIEAARNLATADGEFQKSQKNRTKALVQRFRNLRNEPPYKAIFHSGHLPTLIDAVKDLPNDHGVDVALFNSASGVVLVHVKSDPLIGIREFETNSFHAIARALRGEETVDTIQVAEQLFDVVAIPVLGADGALTGVLTFGSEIRSADLQDLSLLIRS